MAAMTPAERQRKHRASLTPEQREEVRRRDRERKRARWRAMSPEEREEARRRANVRRRARRASMSPEERAAHLARERMRRAEAETKRRAEEGLPPPHWQRDLHSTVRRRDGWRCQSHGCGRDAFEVRMVDPEGDPFDGDNLTLECDSCGRRRQRERWA